MSRSYKKTPRAGDKKDKFYKNYANRRIRRDKYHNFSHNDYKKDLHYYDICDYQTINETFEDFWNRMVKRWYDWEQQYGVPFPDKKEMYKYWYKCYKMK